MAAMEYKESWNMFVDRQRGQWVRVAPGDPRATHQLCVKGCALDFNYMVEDYPLAHKMTDAERQRIEAEHAKWQTMYALKG